MDHGSCCSFSHRRQEPGRIQPLGLFRNTLLGRLGSAEASCLPGPMPASRTPAPLCAPDLALFPVWCQTRRGRAHANLPWVLEDGTAGHGPVLGDATAPSATVTGWPAWVRALGGDGQHGGLMGGCADLGKPWFLRPRVPAPRPACPCVDVWGRAHPAARAERVGSG